MAFTGPGIACDWLDIEGPIHEIWPPRQPHAAFRRPAARRVQSRPRHPAIARRRASAPAGDRCRQEPARSPTGIWTVQSDQPLADADRLLARSCRKRSAGRSTPTCDGNMSRKVAERLKAGDCFETAMRWAYRAALCSPDFLYHVEPAGQLDDYALACRLSYFLWNSMPDERLTATRRVGQSCTKPEVLRGEVERMLKDPKVDSGSSTISWASG